MPEPDPASTPRPAQVNRSPAAAPWDADTDRRIPRARGPKDVDTAERKASRGAVRARPILGVAAAGALVVAAGLLAMAL